MKLLSITKKQIAAITGILMIGFLLGHLTGNFLIFKGPDAINDYAKFLASLGPVLWIMRIGLIVAFVTHMVLTVWITVENRIARGKGYAVKKTHTESKSIAQRTMPLTGSIIFAYLIYHLLDFTFAEHTGIINGQDQGLYGLIINTLSQPIHATIYIIALIGIGLHLTHSIQSVFQTFGVVKPESLPKLQKISLILGLAISAGYISIPLYILFIL